MSKDYEIKLAIAEQAADWAMQLSTATASENAEFVAWLRASPVHVHEFFIAVRIAQRLRGMDPKRQLDAQMYAKRATGSVVPIARVDRHAALGRRTTTTACKVHFGRFAAAIALLTLSLMILQNRATPDRTLVTGAGERQSIQLSDGSHLQVAPRSRIALDFGHRQRLIHLDYGEIALDVAHDPSRPLIVETDLASARAVGTAFAVRRREGGSAYVTVKEGVVAVATPSQSITLKAGDQVRVSLLQPTAVAHVNVGKVLAWTEGNFVFDTESVGEAVAEFNRYNAVQIQLPDPKLADLPIRGVWAANKPELLIAFLRTRGYAPVSDGSTTACEPGSAHQGACTCARNC